MATGDISHRPSVIPDRFDHSLLLFYRQCHVLGRHDISLGYIHVPASAPYWRCANIVACLLQSCYPEFLRLFWDISEKVGDAFGDIWSPDVPLKQTLAVAMARKD